VEGIRTRWCGKGVGVSSTSTFFRRFSEISMVIGSWWVNEYLGLWRGGICDRGWGSERGFKDGFGEEYAVVLV
jgi:hypothetical protein